jgi:hypothetical protein
MHANTVCIHLGKTFPCKSACGMAPILCGMYPSTEVGASSS